MSIKHPNNAKFLKAFKKKFGQDALMNTVGVAMYNAAHMAALAIEKAGKVDTKSLRENLKGIAFNGAPQGPVTMRKDDNQIIVPSYLMQVNPSWTNVNNMFNEVQSLQKVVPLAARCSLPL